MRDVCDVDRIAPALGGNVIEPRCCCVAKVLFFDRSGEECRCTSSPSLRCFAKSSYSVASVDPSVDTSTSALLTTLGRMMV